MTFREKKAWITLITLLVVFGVYFPYMAIAYHSMEYAPHELAQMALAALIVFVVIEVVLIGFVAAKSPADARTPADEREIMIELKSNRLAYVCLMLFVIASVFFMIHVEGGNWGWGHLFFLSVIVAEVINFATQIFLYRRDA